MVSTRHILAIANLKNDRIFEEAQATVKTQNEKPYLARLMHGMDDQSKLVDSMGKLTRFVNLLEVRKCTTRQPHMLMGLIARSLGSDGI